MGCVSTMFRGFAIATGATIEVTLNEGYPAVVNHAPKSVAAVEAGSARIHCVQRSYCGVRV